MRVLWKRAVVGLVASLVFGCGPGEEFPSDSAETLVVGEEAGETVGTTEQEVVVRCIYKEVVDEGPGGGVSIWNTCDSAKRVKVIVHHGPDSECTMLKAGRSGVYTYWTGSFERLIRC